MNHQTKSIILATSCVFAMAVCNRPAHASSHARHHRRHSPSHASSRFAGLGGRPLPSRGAQDTAANATIVGRLGVVLTTNAQIHAGPDRWGRVLAVCAKGQNLAINSQTDTQYGVLMVDNSVGYIDKNDIQLLNQLVVTNPSAADAPAGPLGQKLVQAAYNYLRVPYLWGGDTKDGIDCSGLVKAVFSQCGIELPRHSSDQAAVGDDVPLDDVSAWIPGDRMYFACHHPEIDHTAMYVGGGYFIHASMGHNQQVACDRVDDPYYRRHLVCVRRSRELLGDSGYIQRQPPVTITAPESSPTPDAPAPSAALSGPSYNQSTTAPNVPVAAPQTPATPDVSTNRTVPPAAGNAAPTDPESDQQ